MPRTTSGVRLEPPLTAPVTSGPVNCPPSHRGGDCGSRYSGGLRAITMRRSRGAAAPSCRWMQSRCRCIPRSCILLP
uniref:Uncharacterized protein n=1 Tax=Setaria italica TaxID=4555 RepID=K3ZG96_SETIT